MAEHSSADTSNIAKVDNNECHIPAIPAIPAFAEATIRRLRQSYPEVHQEPSSIASRGTQPFADPSIKIREPWDPVVMPVFTYDTPEMERRRSAREAFTQYNIDRFSGWFLDVEGLSLSGDGNASPREYRRYCHICPTPSRAPTYCSACGHLLCQECIFKIAGSTTRQYKKYNSDAKNGLQNKEEKREEDTATTITTPTSTPGRSSYVKQDYKSMEARSEQPVRENHFLLQDKNVKGKAAERNVSSQAGSRMDCDDPVCQATHVGHRPFRHSVSCSKRANEQVRPQADPFEEIHTDASSQPSEHYRPILYQPDQSQQQASSAASIMLDSQPYGTTDGGTTHEAGHDAYRGHKEEQQSPHPTPSGSRTPKVLLARTPSWLRAPPKAPADAIAALRHVNTKNHDGYKHTHGYSSDNAVARKREHADGGPEPLPKDQIRPGSSYNAVPWEGHDISSVKSHASTTAEIRRSPYTKTPSIKLDRSPPEQKHQDSSMSITKRREVFEPVQDHTDAISEKKANYHEDVRSWHAQHSGVSSAARSGQSQSPIERRKKEDKNVALGPMSDHTTKLTALNSLNLRSGKRKSIEAFPLKCPPPPHPKPSRPRRLEHGGEERSSLVTNKSKSSEPEPEIAKPTPIAPPNHDCAWKERYLALTAEIRHLKAEMSSHALLGSPGPCAAENEQNGEHHRFDLVGVTTILRFGDRGDIVLNADITEDGH